MYNCTNSSGRYTQCHPKLRTNSGNSLNQNSIFSHTAVSFVSVFNHFKPTLPYIIPVWIMKTVTSYLLFLDFAIVSYLSYVLCRFGKLFWSGLFTYRIVLETFWEWSIIKLKKACMLLQTLPNCSQRHPHNPIKEIPRRKKEGTDKVGTSLMQKVSQDDLRWGG